MPNPKHVLFFTGNRSEYGLLRPVIRSVAARSNLIASLVVSGSHLSQEFGSTASEIDVSGLCRSVNLDLPSVGSEDTLPARTIATLVSSGTEVLKELNPDIVVVAGDRYETFGFIQAAFYANVPIGHIFGGDLSEGGHWDDSIRHALTKLSHLHFTTNRDSFDRVLRLGEESWRVFLTGSPAMDTLAAAEYAPPDEVYAALGLVPELPVVLFTLHPVAISASDSREQARAALAVLAEEKAQVIVTYPCNDAGCEGIISAITEYDSAPHFTIRQSLGWRLYLGAMNVASCVVGNSSSGLMETPFFGVPCINIGERQRGRLRADNVLDVDHSDEQLRSALNRALRDDGFKLTAKSCNNPYGEGHAGERIADALSQSPPRKKLLKKLMTY